MLHELYHGLARFFTWFSYRGIISILLLPHIIFAELAEGFGNF